MADDATATGVSEKVGEELETVTKQKEEVVPEISERERIVQQAVESRRADLREEGVELEPEGPPAKAAEAGEELALELEELPETVEVKVDGEVSQVTSDEINERLGTEGKIDQQKIAEFQKHRTADTRLEDAAKVTKANEQQASELAQREAELAVLRETPVGEAPAEIDPEMVAKLTDAILTEDHSETATVLSEIVNSARGPAQTQPTSAQDIDNAVERSLAARDYKDDLAVGQAEVKKKYGHLVGDSVLQAAIDSKAAEIFNADKTKKASEILIEAAEAVNQSILSATKTPESKTDIINKKKQGAAASHSAPAASSTRAPAPETKAAPSTQSVVAGMIASRNDKLAGRAAT